MFDKKQFKDEIEAQLKNVPKDTCVAFAVRSAMRVLPLLAVPNNSSFKSLFAKNGEAFWFWRVADKNKHLLAVLKAYSCSVEYVLTKNIVANAFASTAAFVAALAAAYASAADASADAAAIMQAIQHDLAMLQDITADELLKQALWSEPATEKWQQLCNDFKQDALSLNAGFDIWLDWYDDRLQGKPIDIELLKQWNNIPKEVEDQGVAAINAYLKNLVQKTAVKPLNRVRAIFIGYGEAGKTSLIRALYGEPVMEGKETMTVGIDIRDWSVPNSDIQAHFWDFGGQVMAHATHQFFLRSSCLYVLVLNARSEIARWRSQLIQIIIQTRQSMA
jgi:hypothetical protein